ncbi:hypothetical protein AK830_g7835 [Neonectria ditissima]|uniref:Uncharacterized protein n=1 Tax=Neonectria ditissima TaxID=78410 RepID=A0A0P7BEA6_9HYPO|nr:hypothetical protein AK830_g7835 [Neonectria ditissima]
MWDRVRTDPEKKSGKEHRIARAIKRKRKNKAKATTDIPSLDSDPTSNEPPLPTLGENEDAGDSVMSLFTALASIDIAPAEANFDLESDTESTCSLHGATPRTVCNGPPWTTEDVVILETFFDDSQESPLSKRDAVYISSYDRPSLSSFPPYEPTVPLLDHEDEEQMALEPCNFVQTLTEGSYIARSTQVTTTVRTGSEVNLGLSSQVIVTANVENKTPNRPRSSGTHSQSSFRALMTRSGRSPAVLNTSKRAPSPNVSIREDMTEGWKPPATWDCNPKVWDCGQTTETLFSEIEDVVEEEPVLDDDVSMDPPTTLHDGNRIAKKSSSLHLFRLKRSRSNLKGPSSVKEVEEKKKEQTLPTLWTMDSLES